MTRDKLKHGIDRWLKAKKTPPRVRAVIQTWMMNDLLDELEKALAEEVQQIQTKRLIVEPHIVEEAIKPHE